MFEAKLTLLFFTKTVSLVVSNSGQPIDCAMDFEKKLGKSRFSASFFTKIYMRVVITSDT